MDLFSFLSIYVRGMDLRSKQNFDMDTSPVGTKFALCAKLTILLHLDAFVHGEDLVYTGSLCCTPPWYPLVTFIVILNMSHPEFLCPRPWAPLSNLKYPVEELACIHMMQCEPWKVFPILYWLFWSIFGHFQVVHKYGPGQITRESSPLMGSYWTPSPFVILYLNRQWGFKTSLNDWNTVIRIIWVRQIY